MHFEHSVAVVLLCRVMLVVDGSWVDVGPKVSVLNDIFINLASVVGGHGLLRMLSGARNAVRYEAESSPHRLWTFTTV